VSDVPDAELRRVLADAREAGFLGPDAPERHIDHAGVFIAAVEAQVGPAGPRSFLDLGSGAGVPGLVLALQWSETEAVLVDASQRRCTFAASAAARLGIADRVAVRCDRAEVLGHEADLREHFSVVVARSFGAPAVTAELASPFLEVGGLLLVSEPPASEIERWPAAKLRVLGLGTGEESRHHGYGVATMHKESPLADRYPRRVGIPTKRPLW
jgi:16S rRNA (guanine527-N7)-methyltransferase